MLESNSKIIRKNLPWQEFDEKIIILSPHTKMSHELNETCSWLWKRVEEEKTFESLLFELMEDFEVEEQIARKDLLEILLGLEQKLLVEIHE